MARVIGVASLLVLLFGAGCRHVPSKKDQDGAQIHYDMGIAAVDEGEPQKAYASYMKAIELDPYFPEAHHALGVLLHLSFNKPEEAKEHYLKALELRPEFTEARVNLGNVYLQQSRYAEAAALYEEALNDMAYGTPHLAQGNLGWALYKQGEVDRAVESIRAAITTEPRFCLGYRNLGIIYQEQDDAAEACRNFTRFREACPESPEAYYREGLCRANLGELDAARAALAGCQTKAKRGSSLEASCARLLDELQ